MSAISIVDIVCLVVILGFVLLGFKNGGLYELIQLGFLVGAMILTALLNPIVSNVIYKVLKRTESTENIIYFGTLAIILFLAYTFLAHFIKTLVSFKEPSGANRAIGAAFAAVKGFGYVGLALIIVGLFSSSPKLREGSVTVFIQDTVSKATSVVDSKVKKQDIEIDIPADLDEM